MRLRVPANAVFQICCSIERKHERLRSFTIGRLCKSVWRSSIWSMISLVVGSARRTGKVTAPPRTVSRPRQNSRTDKLYEHVRELLERRAGSRVEGSEIRWHEAPFRGLLPFEYEHAPVFFGRTRARTSCASVWRVRRRAVVPLCWFWGPAARASHPWSKPDCYRT
jgi:hypothetical protein